MAKCYFELRKQAARGTDSIAADIMRHLHTRQYLGKTIIICEQPSIMLSASRKQWLKLARSIQKQRASTLNADKILKYTHTITRMQHMRFTAKAVLEDPEAEVYFVNARHAATMPVHCYTAYLTVDLGQTEGALMLAQLPAEALIVDYNHGNWHALGLQPKRVLEEQVASEWKQAQQFLHGYDIDVRKLFSGPIHNVEAMDDALDTLLGISHKFLRTAGEFQRALELARPLRVGKELRQQYDALSLLAHRVQALTSNAFTQRFLETYNEDDTFFLYDHAARNRFIFGTEGLAEAVARHTKAGRMQLAYALQAVASHSTTRTP
ncbi:MAG TPA: hypothetical protein VMY99_05425 [Nevskiaceae bacterium]|nr:hypothetical protein [Nevskiaceae bacterium]